MGMQSFGARTKVRIIDLFLVGFPHLPHLVACSDRCPDYGSDLITIQ